MASKNQHTVYLTDEAVQVIRWALRRAVEVNSASRHPATFQRAVANTTEEFTELMKEVPLEPEQRPRQRDWSSRFKK